MPTYRIPPSHHAARVDALKMAYVFAAVRDQLLRDRDGMVYHTILNAIAEVLYVRGLDHQIVDALLKEWGNEAFEQVAEYREKQKKGT